MPYTGNNNGNNVHGTGYHYHQSHSIGGSTASSNFLFPPNVDFQQQQFLHPSQVPPSASQRHNFSLFSPAGSSSNPNLSSDNYLSFSPGISHFRRASSSTRSDRGGELCCTSGTQGGSPYPNPNILIRMLV